MKSITGIYDDVLFYILAANKMLDMKAQRFAYQLNGKSTEEEGRVHKGNKGICLIRESNLHTVMGLTVDTQRIQRK